MVIVQHYRAHVALPGPRVCVRACVGGKRPRTARVARSPRFCMRQKLALDRGRVTVTLRSRGLAIDTSNGDDRQKYHPLSVPIAHSRFPLFPPRPRLPPRTRDYTFAKRLVFLTCVCEQIVSS